MRRAIASTAVLLLFAAEPAAAHGPCTCLDRFAGAPGQRVEVLSRSIRGVLNPRRAQIPYGPRDLWADRRAGVRPRTLYRSRRPRRHTFRVPSVPPGRYVIAIFDGSEGGSHYTWARFRVRRR